MKPLRPACFDRRPFCLILTIALPFALTAPADCSTEMLASREILQQITDDESGEDSAPSAKDRRRELAELSPSQAASQWLAWADAYLAGSDEEPLADMDEGFEKLIEILPGPESWKPLAELIQDGEKRRGAHQQLHMELFASVLLDEQAQQRALLRAIDDSVRGDSTGARGELLQSWTGSGGNHYQQARVEATGSLIDQFIFNSSDPSHVRDLLTRRIQYPASQYGSDQRYVPDLVGLFGEAEARNLIAQLLRESPAGLEFHGEASRRLAREIALIQIEEVEAAPWNLIDSFQHLELYEALADRFPPSGDRYNYDRQEARMHYLVGLLTHERLDEAVDLVGEMDLDSFYFPGATLRDLEQTGHLEHLQVFFEKLLADDPELPLWDTYLSIAASRGGTQSAVPFITEILESRQWGEQDTLRLREQLAEARLSGSEFEAAVKMIREDIRKVQEDESPNPDTANWLLRRGVRLARIGHLLNEPQWQEEGLAIAESARTGIEEGNYPSRALLQLYEETGQLAQAQRLALEQLQAKVERDSDYSWGTPTATAELLDLAHLYHRADLPEEILVLLKEAPWWGTGDIAEFVTATGNTGEPIGYLAASALAETGEPEKAASILRELLLANGGYDPAYELLIEIDVDDAIAWFNRLFDLDPFEERPLIWKAKVRLDQGSLEEAQRLVEQAIAIDPSDGEQGPGHRMRAYEVLAEILAEVGDSDKSDFYREVVAAIRLSEHADEFYQAGLRERGVKMYREALTHFADAYCVQSRLATQLQELGRQDEAEEHYRRAYELMPDSFGRVESHCFGCEAVFSGERAQSTAERVFAKFREERPEQPQVWYLSGYLEFERRRYAKAVEYFVKATKLDPNYLNAWSKLLDTRRFAKVDRDVIDRATLQLLRLDPLQRHSPVNLAGVSNLERLWKVAQQSFARLPERVETLLPLPAAAALLEENDDQSRTYFHYSIGLHDRADALRNPSILLASHDVLRQIASSLDSTVH